MAVLCRDICNTSVIALARVLYSNKTEEMLSGHRYIISTLLCLLIDKSRLSRMAEESYEIFVWDLFQDENR